MKKHVRHARFTDGASQIVAPSLLPFPPFFLVHTRFFEKQFLPFCLRCLYFSCGHYLFYSTADEIVRSNSTPVDGIGVE